jgi:hypothetical protein
MKQLFARSAKALKPCERSKHTVRKIADKSISETQILPHLPEDGYSLWLIHIFPGGCGHTN